MVHVLNIFTLCLYTHNTDNRSTIEYRVHVRVVDKIILLAGSESIGKPETPNNTFSDSQFPNSEPR